MIAQRAMEAIRGGSVTRKMFDEGTRLKQVYGEDQVCDFSLGNPDQAPPNAVQAALAQEILDPMEGGHHYMSNAGYQATREACASREQKRAGWSEPLPYTAITMTVGAASALTCAFFALLDPGDEVIIPKPFFAEYLNYLKLRGAVPVFVETEPETFQLDPSAIEAAITPRTRALLINSPNNPSGAIYTLERLQATADVLKRASERVGRPVYIVSDEPYVELVYGEQPVPSLLNVYPDTLICYSWSKSFALPGERIGYVCVSPRAQAYEDLIQAVPLGLRILGFVNAPAIWQRVIARAIDAPVNVRVYQERRDQLVAMLQRCGYSCASPDGAFYLLLQAPDGDATGFADRLAAERILVVPADGFGARGYVRIAYCVGMEVILRAEEGFAKVRQSYESPIVRRQAEDANA